ncbi:MAG TPA: HAD family hydrolase [Symbiobacteriaceae bacterium]|nr:HAD family hydrolase [Symbiobacteriaceae bacterium]
MNPRLAGLQWLFLDPSLILNETETEREQRRILAALLQKRGRPVTQEQVERAWMAAISAAQPQHPLLGAARALAPDPSSAEALAQEVTRTARPADTLWAGVQLALGQLSATYRVAVVGPYRAPGSKARLERFSLKLEFLLLSEESGLSHRMGPTGKPDGALFTAALRKVGAPAARALFATDRVDLGVAPAKSTGLATAWVRITNHKLRHPRNSMETPDVTVTSLRELAGALSAP